MDDATGAGDAQGRIRDDAPPLQTTTSVTGAVWCVVRHPISHRPKRRSSIAGSFRSLRVRNYRLYAAGQLVSLTGTWMQRVAQDWLILELTGSGTALGVVTALQFAPPIVLGLWGGALADRHSKRKILMATQVSFAGVALGLGLLDLAGVVQVWHVLLLATILGVINAVDSPTRQAFVIELVTYDDIPNAVAINSVTFNAARILGPALAGGVIAAAGTSWAFLANAASSLAVLLGLWQIRPAELYPAPVVRRARGQLIEGVRYVRHRADLVLVMVLILGLETFGLNFQITMALMAKQVFHKGASGYGLFSTALAFGACIGAASAASRVKRPSRAFLLTSAVVTSGFVICSGLMPSYGLTALVLVPTGLATMLLMTDSNSYVQLSIEPAMQGRVMALYVICCLGGTALGAPLVGWAAGTFGARYGVVGGGLLCLATALTLAAIVLRRPDEGSALPRRDGAVRASIPSAE